MGTTSATPTLALDQALAALQPLEAAYNADMANDASLTTNLTTVQANAAASISAAQTALTQGQAQTSTDLAAYLAGLQAAQAAIAATISNLTPPTQ